MKIDTSNECWSRLEQVIHYSGLPSVNAFALHIGLPRAENLYQIRKGNNGISKRLAERICRIYPDISPVWLLTGNERMIRDGEQAEKIVAKIEALLKTLVTLRC